MIFDEWPHPADTVVNAPACRVETLVKPVNVVDSAVVCGGVDCLDQRPPRRYTPSPEIVAKSRGSILLAKMDMTPQFGANGSCRWP